MKPVSASDILRKSAPRETIGQTFLHANRYDSLRDTSPASTVRNRTESNASSKRKIADHDDFFEHEETGSKAKVSRLDDKEEEELVFLDSKISKVSTVCGKLLTVVQQNEISVDDSLRSLLADLIDAVKVTNEVQSELSTKYKEMRLQQVNMANMSSSYSAVASGQAAPRIILTAEHGKNNKQVQRKKPAGGLVQMSSGGSTYSQGKNISEKPTETEEEKRQRRFAESIRDAERSTLCFNLNMGNRPIMNKVTISERASLALTTMAANVEAKGKSYPSPDAIAAIDDVTSMVTNMEFYGTKTAEYKGKDSSGYCTVPVRYQFKDKEQRAFAEKTLREVCKVKCAIPYPAIVRDCIKQVVEHVRISHPGDFVKVSVVPKEFSLRVARRPPGKNLKWIEYPDLLRLPEEALDVSARKSPEGLRMFYLPVEEMVTSPVQTEKPKSPVKGRVENTNKK
jgi:hypothetical protein